MGSPYYRVRLMLELVLRKIDSLESRISALSQEIKAPHAAAGNMVYLSTGLQATVKALKTFTGPASAEQVAAITERSRPVESSYLNELFRNGMVLKQKQGHMKVFILKEEYRER